MLRSAVLAAWIQQLRQSTSVKRLELSRNAHLALHFAETARACWMAPTTSPRIQCDTNPMHFASSKCTAAIMAPRLLAYAVVVCMLLHDASAIVSPSIGRTISFQAHSYDDMREWIQVRGHTILSCAWQRTSRQCSQLFNKGTRYLKLDPHYMPASFCATQTGVLNASDPRGCMVLSHDNPVASRSDYNTTDQIPVVLADPAYRSACSLAGVFVVALSGLTMWWRVDLRRVLHAGHDVLRRLVFQVCTGPL